MLSVRFRWGVVGLHTVILTAAVLAKLKAHGINGIGLNGPKA